MLKVVGASWLQTRISTYILVAVGLLGIGAIILGEFGSIEKDGTYSATVFWNHKGGYRIDFWGQGNDLISVPRGAARAYYKPRIEETGWSIVEIETSPTYPDTVQAYAAGLLEGSLTWQLIHHHWYNTIGTMCASEDNEERCSKIRHSLRENTAIIREKADLLANEDPFWHMVKLFYAQLDGMETGWRFAVRRSRRSVDMDTEDFLWLAMASDLPEHLVTSETSAAPLSNELPELPVSSNINNGIIFLKSLDRSDEGLDPLIVVAQNTVAPYSKMLRLLKRYTFGYHLSGTRHSPRIPTRTIIMSSYPGAASSHDEYYIVRGGKEDDDLMILAAIPLKDSPDKNLSETGGSGDQENGQEQAEEIYSAIQGVMSPARIMAANRLTTEARSWSRLLARGDSAKKTDKSSPRRQWLSVKPKDSMVWLIEQHPAFTHAKDYTESFAKNGFVYCHGDTILEETTQEIFENGSSLAPNLDIAEFFRDNITSVEDIRKLMRGSSNFLENENVDEIVNGSQPIKSFARIESRVSHSIEPLGKFVFRGDLGKLRKPVGVIDTKISIAMADGLESFEATSGPPFGHELDNDLAVPFDWSQHFPNISHIGQPEKFEFDSVAPQWIWL